MTFHAQEYGDDLPASNLRLSSLPKVVEDFAVCIKVLFIVGDGVVGFEGDIVGDGVGFEGKWGDLREL